MHFNTLRIKSILSVTSLCLLPAIASADTLSVTAGGGVWNESPSGTVQKTSDPIAIDMNNDLFLNTETQGYFFASLEHPIPFLPNLRVMYTNMKHTGNGTATFTFNNINFSGNVNSNVNIKVLDLIAYYEVLDNVVSLDLGLDARKLDIDYTVTSSSLGVTTTDSTSRTIPMVYALVGASPWPGILISANIKYIQYSGNKLSDITAKIAYTTDFHIGVEAGYRRQKLTLDNIDSTNADVTFDGAFAGAYVKF